MATQEKVIKFLSGSSCLTIGVSEDTAYSGFGELGDNMLAELRKDLFSQLSRQLAASDSYGKTVKIKLTAEVLDL